MKDQAKPANPFSVITDQSLLYCISILLVGENVNSNI